MTLRSSTFALLSLAMAGCATTSSKSTSALVPKVDYHQHLVSPAFAEVAKLPVFDAAALLKRLDGAGVRQAVVLSMGYSLADERKALTDPDRRTREENDWTSAQIAPTRGRLIGFCGVNPLREEALREISRCLALPGMRGLKLHFGNSGVSLRNPAHLARMAQVFRLVGKHKAPVLVHMRARGGENFGGPDAAILIRELLPLAPESDVIVAHFGGAGPGYPAQADEVTAVFASAIEHNDPRVARTYFDVATILTKDSSADETAAVGRRIRQIGARRVLYGSDLIAIQTAPSIQEAWSLYEAKLNLTTRERRAIASNRLPFVR